MFFTLDPRVSGFVLEWAYSEVQLVWNILVQIVKVSSIKVTWSALSVGVLFELLSRVMCNVMFLKLCAAFLVLWVGTVKGAKPVVRSMSIDSTGKVKAGQGTKPVVRSMSKKGDAAMSIEATGTVNEKRRERPVVRKVNQSAAFDTNVLATELQSLEKRVATIENAMQTSTGVWGMSAQGQTCTDFCASEGYTCNNDEAIPMLKTLAGQDVTSLVGRRRSGSADWFGDTVLGEDGKDCSSVKGDSSRRRYQYGVMLDWNDECYAPSDTFTETDPCSGTGDGEPAYTWRSWRSLCWCHGTVTTTTSTTTTTTTTNSCQVTVYEHWPDNITADIAGEQAANAWGGHFPTGVTMVVHGTGKQTLSAAISNLTSSVKVEGDCCKAYGFTNQDCSGDRGNPIEVTTPGLSGLPNGVVTPATGLESVWGCNDCAQCIEVVQECPTEAPTSAPTTQAPTLAPTTQAPTSSPTTQSPTTEAPTSAPTTQAPTRANDAGSNEFAHDAITHH